MSTLEESVGIQVDDQSISGTFVTPGTLVPGVLFVHGWGGSQDQYLSRAREVAALGCICLTFDLRGHAQTRTQYETVSRDQNLRDLLAAYDLLVARRHVDPHAIAVVGSSYGGYLSAILTAMRPVKWLALRAPALYIDTGWKTAKLQLHKDQDLKGYRRTRVPAADNRALRACQEFDGDVLLIESELDDIIPQSVLASYREACHHARSVTYRCMAAADHGLTQEVDQQAYSGLLVHWLGEMVADARLVRTDRAAGPAPVEPRVPEVPPETLTATTR
ncbi:MAG: alpha/beta fold hydrolase [Burkholderiales bacterium]